VRDTAALHHVIAMKRTLGQSVVISAAGNRRTLDMKTITSTVAAIAVALMLSGTVTLATQFPLQLISLNGDPGPFNPNELPPTFQTQ
jgi:hypothetical protein